MSKTALIRCIFSYATHFSWLSLHGHSVFWRWTKFVCWVWCLSRVQNVLRCKSWNPYFSRFILYLWTNIELDPSRWGIVRNDSIPPALTLLHVTSSSWFRRDLHNIFGLLMFCSFDSGLNTLREKGVPSSHKIIYHQNFVIWKKSRDGSMQYGQN